LLILPMEIKRTALLPNLLTIANGVCGYHALVRLGKISVGPDGNLLHGENFTIAAYLVLLGMIFDVFDGKLARTFGGGSELGAQLDSLCDLVTFGLVPAVMILRMNLEPASGGSALDAGGVGPWQKVVWFLALAYFLGALLRLARFNVENAPDESAHLAFKGLPSPAAAGCVASLVIFQRYILKFDANELQWIERWLSPSLRQTISDQIAPGIKYVLAFLAPVLGFAMVSDRIRFAHMGSTLLGRRQSFDFLVYLIFGVLFLFMVPEIVLPLAFFGYLAWPPMVIASKWIASRLGRAPREESAQGTEESEPERP